MVSRRRRGDQLSLTESKGGGDIENLLQQKTFKTTKTLNYSRVTLLAHRGVSVAQWLKVWGSIPHEDSGFFLCPTFVTRRTKIFLYTSISFPFLKINKSFFILIISNSYCSFGQDSWILASFLFLRFSELWLVTVHKNAKKKKKKEKELCQYPAIWTSRLVNTHIYQKWIKSESKGTWSQLIHVMA